MTMDCFSYEQTKGVNYDFGVVVNFRQINITPEQIKEKEFIKEKKSRTVSKRCSIQKEES